MRFILKTLTLLALLALLALLVSGCVSVSYLPTDDNITYPPTNSLKVFWEKPDIPHKVIGMLIAEDYGEEELFAVLKKKAMSIGAQGIIMKSPTQQIRIYGYSSPRAGTFSANRSHRLEAIAIRFNESEMK